MKRCINLKSGKEYYFIGGTSIKIPGINYWIHLIKYQDISTENCFYRFKTNFYTNFKIKE